LANITIIEKALFEADILLELFSQGGAKLLGKFVGDLLLLVIIRSRQ